MNTLISVEEAKSLGRPLGDIKVDKIKTYIEEVEHTQIKPFIGDELFMKLHRGDPDDRYDKLLNGGEYRDCRNVSRFFSGLKTTIAYFVYVKTLLSADIESTRYGFMQKDGQYSAHISTAQRSAAYNEAMEVAKVYLDECLEYCRHKGIEIKSSRRGAAAGGCTIRRIG